MTRRLRGERRQERRGERRQERRGERREERGERSEERGERREERGERREERGERREEERGKRREERGDRREETGDTSRVRNLYGKATGSIRESYRGGIREGYGRHTVYGTEGIRGSYGKYREGYEEVADR